MSDFRQALLTFLKKSTMIDSGTVVHKGTVVRRRNSAFSEREREEMGVPAGMTASV